MGEQDTDLHEEQQANQAPLTKRVHDKAGEEYIDGCKQSPASQLKDPVARDEWPTHVSTNLKGWFVNCCGKYTSGRYILQMEMRGRWHELSSKADGKN
jgi:hypothetical protein